MEREERAARVGELFLLDGEVAVVTGGSSGIGQAAAEALALAGANVALLGRDEGRLDVVRSAILAGGGNARSYPVDVADPEGLERVFAMVRDELGAPSIVVANAGIGAGPSYSNPGGALAEYEVETWRRVVATNLDGVFFTLRAAVNVVPDGARMIVTASTAGLRADPMVGYAYVATKAGVLNLVRQAALEFAPRGIRVNAIAPGPFRTNIGGGPMPPDRAKQWEATLPLGRMGDTSELRGIVLLLASGASSFITGATVAVDGGALALSHTLW